MKISERSERQDSAAGKRDYWYKIQILICSEQQSLDTLRAWAFGSFITEDYLSIIEGSEMQKTAYRVPDLYRNLCRYNWNDRSAGIPEGNNPSLFPSD